MDLGGKATVWIVGQTCHVEVDGAIGARGLSVCIVVFVESVFDLSSSCQKHTAVAALHNTPEYF